MTIFEIVFLSLYLGSAVYAFATAGEVLFLFKFMPDRDAFSVAARLFCLGASQVLALLIAQIVWLFWPFEFDIMAWKFINLPAVVGEIFSVPVFIWALKRIKIRKRLLYEFFTRTVKSSPPSLTVTNAHTFLGLQKCSYIFLR